MELKRVSKNKAEAVVENSIKTLNAYLKAKGDDGKVSNFEGIDIGLNGIGLIRSLVKKDKDKKGVHIDELQELVKSELAHLDSIQAKKFTENLVQISELIEENINIMKEG